MCLTGASFSSLLPHKILEFLPMTMQLYQGAQAFVIQCDSCPEALDTEHIAWAAARDAAYENGWRIYIGPDKKWAHSCPACTEDFAKRNRR